MAIVPLLMMNPRYNDPYIVNANIYASVVQNFPRLYSIEYVPTVYPHDVSQYIPFFPMFFSIEIPRRHGAECAMTHQPWGSIAE